MLEGTIVQRWTPELVKEAESTPLIGPSAGGAAGAARAAAALNTKAQAFFLKEGVVAELDRSSDAYMVHGDNQMSWRTQRAYRSRRNGLRRAQAGRLTAAKAGRCPAGR